MIGIDAMTIDIKTHSRVKEAQETVKALQDEQSKVNLNLSLWYDEGRARTILQWLSTANYGVQQSDLRKVRRAGAGQWLLDSAEYNRWCDTRGKMLYCHGMPGCGKTVMTSIVIDQLETRFENHAGTFIAYLYFNFRR